MRDPVTDEELNDMGDEYWIERNSEWQARLEAAEAENERLRGEIREAGELLSARDDNGFPSWVSAVEEILADALANTPTPNEPETLSEKHMRHYRSCNCLGDSAECCRTDCECHVVHGTPSEGEKE